MDTDFIKLQNMLSDIKEWKTELQEVQKEREKLDDREEALEDDISGTYAAIQEFIQQLTDPESK